MTGLALISRPETRHQEARIAKVAEWMGVATRTIMIGERPEMDQLAAQLGGGNCLALGTGTLGFLRERLPPHALQDFIASTCTRLLVFSIGRPPQQGDLLAWLTGRAVRELSSPTERRVFRAPESGAAFSRAFAGQWFTLKRSAAVSTFELAGTGGGSGIREILLADERAVFLSLQRGACELFLLSLADIPDIDERLPRSTGVEECYDRLIPLLIFLRHCFDGMLWHSPGKTARLIIDDPLLDRTYGFLDYGALRESMRSARYGTSMAFIPWNHWRTSRKRAATVFDGNANLSICVHGCDHTNKEFDELDQGSLHWKAGMALSRMERHRSRTGLPFDPIMVFPQGRFTSAAIRALRDSGYLAAVNSTCFPTDPGAEPLTIADFLRPAITRFHGFPIFQRRYPRRLVDFAFDVFLGRPVLLVQHHGDFGHGYRQLEEFVGDLYRIEPKLTWSALSDQLMRSCMMRSRSHGSAEVLFLTAEFRFVSPLPERTTFAFSKREPDASVVDDVLVDGTSVPFSIDDGLLHFEHQIGPGQAIDVRVLDRRLPAPAFKRRGVVHAVGVSTRRALSEFRDNTLATRPRLLAAATGIATRMKLTGSSSGNGRA